jgi:hypothetical protein
MSVPDLTIDDAIGIIIDQIKNAPDQLRQYGYEVWLPLVIYAHLRKAQPSVAQTQMAAAPVIQELSPIFYAAGWELARRGILRPGVWRQGEQVTESGPAGDGYTLTPLGRQWLAAADPLLFVPMEPSRLGAMLAGFARLFGPGFNQRAQEAVKCNFATAHLACCAMCGAAAESILLAVAIARRGDEAAVLSDYRASGGRARVEKSLLGQVPEPVRSRFHTFMDLLNYWRDDSTHGVVTTIGDVEAYDALSRLLRLAHFASDQWTVLTGKPKA